MSSNKPPVSGASLFLARNLQLSHFAFAAPVIAGVVFASTCAAAEPDIQGLRIGATVEATRAMFKSRVLNSKNLQNTYREETAQLMYFVPGRGAETVPNSKFFAKISAAGGIDDSPKQFAAVFGPEPQREGVIAIFRNEVPTIANRPTLGVLEKAVHEKYGPPTFSSPPIDKRAPHNRALTSYWVYNSGGAPRAATSFDMRHWPGCLQHHAASISQELWVIKTAGGVKTMEQLLANCGAVLLSMGIGLSDSPGPNTLVEVYTTTITGFEAALRQLKAAGELTAKARDAATDTSIKKGQQVKPPSL